MAIVGLWASVSCEKAVDFRGEEQSPVIVVTSVPEPDTTISLRVTYSRFFLAGGDFRPVAHATVSVAANGNSYAGVYNGSRYNVPYTVQQGDSLSLVLRIPQSDTVLTASTRVPFRPQAVSKGVSGRNLRFSLSDRPGERNYYRVSLLAVDTMIHYYDSNGHYVLPDDAGAVGCDTVVDTTNIYFSCSDAALTSDASSLNISLDGDEIFWQLYFTDELFDAQTREINLVAEENIQYDYEYEKDGSGIIRYYLLRVESLSREAYLYEISRSKQDDGDFFLTEPVQVQCNIVGGIGIFAAKSVTVLTFKNANSE